jgi:hypothetical protein
MVNGEKVISSLLARYVAVPTLFNALKSYRKSLDSSKIPLAASEPGPIWGG